MYKKYLLGLLLLLLAFNYVDRYALGLLLQSIKHDLHLTDTELGVLTGIAFAAFYAVMGIPIARWADRGNRVVIISITAVLWSSMVALCGAALSFTQFLLIRIGVAVGEAGCVPPAHSLIADYFERSERARAVGIFMLGQFLAVLIGYFAAGWINQFYGWRTTFFVLGPPGTVLALLAFFTLREPRRNSVASRMGHPSGVIAQAAGTTTTQPPDLTTTFRILWANVTFRNMLLAFSVAYFFGTGLTQWQPSFFVRSFGLATGELGTWFAVMHGLGGLVGTYAGGWLASRYAANNERAQLLYIAAMYILYGLLHLPIYLSSNYYVAFGLIGLYTLQGATALAPFFAVIQTLVPERMRATAIAFIYLFANLIGMGLGPLAVGALSDALRPLVGEDSLRYALAAFSPGYLWVAWFFWRASKTVVYDLEAKQLYPMAKAHPAS